MAEKQEMEAQLRLFEKQEQLLQFEHFSNADAWEVGYRLVQRAEAMKAPVALDITVNGFNVFRYAFNGTTPNNDLWLKRKANTVRVMCISSIHAGMLLAYNDKKIDANWLLSPFDYTGSGGGFPISLKGTGVIGTICCSGLAQEEDHQLIVDVLCDYLNIDPTECRL